MNSVSFAQACLPLFIAIAACGLLAAVLIRATFSRETRWPAAIHSPGAIRTSFRFHRDTRGAVQSLAFVLTLPLLILILLFIVQLSQLLIGVVTVQYAAFAAARAASVWIPAVTIDSSIIPSGRSTNANVLPAAAAVGSELVWNSQAADSLGSRKTREIWSAAALACVSISPSRTTASATTSSLAPSTAGALTAVVRAIDSNASANGRLPQRLSNKTNYSFANTTVALRFDDRSSIPFAGEIHTYNPVGHPTIPNAPAEVGWQDPVEVTVRHKFALLPGPGRWLAAGIANGDGRIVLEDGVYKTTLSATATMTIEGLQSLRPRTHAP
ncbi:hypothetical protein Pan44_27290 [Caulifigura coniformis]|uniref:TadE-like domain-containing protein n=1 Tax=Caulifigura coniformis TaxID=2527983 RepID=A0A517SEY6_9PLAN|nr:TadE/TadG family type IV pilus assembly protein [Caulifigura coniformis]QDT54694.1 hypothetical protein Pan44_27290 [Caulifigura coniformis]